MEGAEKKKKIKWRGIAVIGIPVIPISGVTRFVDDKDKFILFTKKEGMFANLQARIGFNRNRIGLWTCP